MARPQYDTTLVPFLLCLEGTIYLLITLREKVMEIKLTPSQWETSYAYKYSVKPKATDFTTPKDLLIFFSFLFPMISLPHHTFNGPLVAHLLLGKQFVRQWCPDMSPTPPLCDHPPTHPFTPCCPWLLISSISQGKKRLGFPLNLPGPL